MPSSTKLRWSHFYRMADIIPPGESGNVKIDHFMITKDTFQGFQVEQTAPGEYARLYVGGSVMMSDTDMELRTNYHAVRDARGDVFIGGLGLGMITLPILKKPEVTSVTVVELNPHVIALVEPSLRKAAGPDAQKLTVIEGDVKTWRPEVRKLKRR